MPILTKNSTLRILVICLAYTFVCSGITAASADTPMSSDFEIFYDNATYSITLPLDKLLKRNVTVVNTGNSYLELEFVLYYVEINTNQTGWPQPNYLYLDPGENQTIWVVIDSYFTGVSTSSPEGTYNRTVQVIFLL
jgi:hypothetical protein